MVTNTETLSAVHFLHSHHRTNHLLVFLTHENTTQRQKFNPTSQLELPHTHERIKSTQMSVARHLTASKTKWPTKQKQNEGKNGKIISLRGISADISVFRHPYSDNKRRRRQRYRVHLLITENVAITGKMFSEKHSFLPVRRRRHTLLYSQ